LRQCGGSGVADALSLVLRTDDADQLARGFLVNQGTHRANGFNPRFRRDVDVIDKSLKLSQGSGVCPVVHQRGGDASGFLGICPQQSAQRLNVDSIWCGHGCDRLCQRDATGGVGGFCEPLPDQLLGIVGIEIDQVNRGIDPLGIGRSAAADDAQK
jgi:hypothetical protein